MPEVYHPIIAFYLGLRPDTEGRKIEEIWGWDYGRLEVLHDFIQWLFPLREKSMVNEDAPVLNQEVIKKFKKSEELRSRLLHSFELMLGFYGLELVGNEVCLGDNFAERKQNWLRRGNHNFLRITRILKCLGYLGLKKEAVAFFGCLQKIYEQEGDKIGSVTFGYWQASVRD